MKMKDTLLMPFTKFEMRANLASKQDEIQKKWEKENLYETLLEKNKDRPFFILHDGPPYANGNIHTGHALNKILKDIIVRYKAMSGFNSVFIPGWDAHGLPIENAVLASGVDRKNLDIVEFRNICLKYAYQQIKTQARQMKALGTIGDYKNPYITLQANYEARQINIFYDLALKGLIFKGLKPVYWSYASESALAESEIVYEDKEDTSIYVKFKVKDGKDLLPNDAYFVIWTTTPWTIPANLAITLNENLEYGLFDTNLGKLVFLTSLKEKLSEEFNLTDVKLIKTFKGKEAEYLTTTHPFYDRQSLIILGNHVTSEAGTGCVHTAPGHGAEDFIVGREYGLDVLCPVDEKGYLTDEAGSELSGLIFYDANEKVIEMLKREKALIKAQKFRHSYPHDWRLKKPIIFRATSQWFASIENLKQEILDSLDNVNFVNPWGKIRITNMIKDRGDWCISRQRYWGVPIPIIYNEDHSPIIDKEVFDHVENIVRQKGSNAWYELDVKDLLPKGYKNPLSPNNKFYKEVDTMDVWFDSGTSHTGVLIERGLPYPADLYLEGSDQYRGWFNSSLILGVLKHHQAPYKSLLSHGFILDEKGNKMSKSLGNTVDPDEIVSSQGADILRLWVSSVDFQSDIKIGEELLRQISDNYRKIRNTLRFILGNLNKGSKEEFNLVDDNVDSYEYVDLLILEKLKDVTNKIINNYDSYNFMSVIQNILNFLSNDLSSFYLDISKDILYCEAKDSLRRKQVQNVLYKLLINLVSILTPLIPHTCDEVLANYDLKVSSTQLLEFPKFEEVDKNLLNEYNILIDYRSKVLKSLEESRSNEVIRSSQEATIELEINNIEILNLINKFSSLELKRFFIVSDVIIKKGNVEKVTTKYHDGIKCERCWNKFNEDEIEENLCKRCQRVVETF